LAKETRLCRRIFAPSAKKLHIVFGEADPPFVWRATQTQKFQKIVFTLLPAREKKLRSLHLQPTVYRNQGIQHNVKDNAYQFHALIGLALYLVRGSLA
jgi:hypothetical protein